MRARALLAGAAALAALTLVGCTTQPDLSSDYSKSAGKGYVSGDGSVITLPVAKRQATPRWSVEDYDGTTVSSASLRGDVVVLNFWYAGCPPCRAEAPDLVKLHDALAPKGVRFLGVNTRDGAVTAKEFAAKYDLGYPSVLDASDNTLTQTFAGDVAPNAVPVTLVLDREGRIAARFSGEIRSVATVQDVVDDVLAEKA